MMVTLIYKRFKEKKLIFFNFEKKINIKKIL